MLVERLPLAIGDSDLHVLVAAGDKPNGPALERHMMKRMACLLRWQFQTPRPINAAVTPTAGGLLFTADLGGRFYAFDASSGQVLWQHELGQASGRGIVTYLANGRQRVAIASGMKSPFWPGPIDASRIIIFGI